MTSVSSTFKHQTGVSFVLISALVFSSAGIFTKGVTADAWAVIFWRGLAAAIFTLGYLVVRGQLKKEIMLFSGPALAVTVLSALGTVAFIPAFKLTSVANVALIYAAAPFVTAALAWVFIGERPTRIVLIASLAAFGGVCVIFAGSAGGGGLTGDMLAFWMTLMMAGMMVVYRRWPETTAALPAALASLVLLPVALVFGEPLTVLQSELPILVLFGLIFAVASVTLSEGARRLPPAETALLSALETPLAPALALLILSEMPSTATIVGGIVIFCAVIWSLRAKQN
jgi:drug/metabolite transporter (DMT)-like permease